MYKYGKKPSPPNWFYGFEDGIKAYPRSIKRATCLLLWQNPNSLGHLGCIAEKASHWLEIESEKSIYLRNSAFLTSHFCGAELVPNPNSNIHLVTSSAYLSPLSARTPFMLPPVTNSRHLLSLALIGFFALYLNMLEIVTFNFNSQPISLDILFS